MKPNKVPKIGVSHKSDNGGNQTRKVTRSVRKYYVKSMSVRGLLLEAKEMLDNGELTEHNVRRVRNLLSSYKSRRKLTYGQTETLILTLYYNKLQNIDVGDLSKCAEDKRTFRVCWGEQKHSDKL